MRCLALDIGGTKIAAALVKNGESEKKQNKRTAVVQLLSFCEV